MYQQNDCSNKHWKRQRKYYATNEELIQDIGVAYQEVIKQFYKAGCRNLQLDDCTWGSDREEMLKQRYKAWGGLILKILKKQLLTVNNLALEGRPEDMVITSHICRGNIIHSSQVVHMMQLQIMYLQKENVDALFLEYDDENLEDLHHKKVSEDKKLSLV